MTRTSLHPENLRNPATTPEPPDQPRAVHLQGDALPTTTSASHVPPSLLQSVDRHTRQASDPLPRVPAPAHDVNEHVPTRQHRRALPVEGFELDAHAPQIPFEVERILGLITPGHGNQVTDNTP